MIKKFVYTLIAIALVFSPIFQPISLSAETIQLKGKILNGTTGKVGQAEQIILFRLAQGMDQITSKGVTEGGFEFEVEAPENESPFLLQVIYKGVIYNHKINLGKKPPENVTIPVYELVDSPGGFDFRVPHLFLNREGENISVRQIIEVSNASQPPKTWYQKEGALRFYVPLDSLEDVKAAATYSSALPIALSLLKTSKKNIYSIDYPFKPGTTNISLSYSVKYTQEQFIFSTPVIYPLREINLFVSPVDAQLIAPALTAQPFDSSMGFLYYKGNNLKTGSMLEIKMSGGSKTAPMKAQSPQHSITTINTMVSEFTIPLLLTFGILLLFGTVILIQRDRNNRDLREKKRRQSQNLLEKRDRLIAEIADLDSRFANHDDSNELYNTQRNTLKNKLKNILQQLNSTNHPEK